MSKSSPSKRNNEIYKRDKGLGSEEKKQEDISVLKFVDFLYSRSQTVKSQNGCKFNRLSQRE